MRILLIFCAVLMLPGVSFGALVNGSVVDLNRFSHNVSGGDGNYLGADPTYGGVGGGGEFRITPIGGGDFFKTFCIEFNEHISLGADYKISINGGAVKGGLAGAIAPGYDYDPLDEKTQFLYAKYRTDQLDQITSFRYDDQNWANALQLVIWRLEEEVNSNWKSNAASPAAIANDASISKAGTLWCQLNAISDYSFQGQVKVLNLWSVTTTLDLNRLDEASYRASKSSLIDADKKQSQLYWEAFIGTTGSGQVPEPSALVAWSGLIIIGGLARRRKVSR